MPRLWQKKNHRLKCTGVCKKWFHTKAECTNYSQEELNKIINGKKAFICEDCGNEDQALEESLTSDTDENSSEFEESYTTRRSLRKQKSPPNKEKKTTYLLWLMLWIS